MEKNNQVVSPWIDQLVDLIIDFFLWEWKSGRLAKDGKDSYIKHTNNSDVDAYESNNSHQV